MAATFVWTTYASQSLNPDLVGKFTNEAMALDHYQKFGAHERRLISADEFDAAYYLSRYADVAAAYTAATAINHYVHFGINEGRIAAASMFDAASYLSNNADLVAAGYTVNTAVNHYTAFGFKEGRLANYNWFDAATYLANNSDLVAAGYTTATAINHYQSFGRFENRVGVYTPYTGSVTAAGAVGQTYTLTKGADIFTGTVNNDTFTATDSADGGVVGTTWTVGDKLDGGAGTDTFSVTQTAAIALPTGATVTNIENLNLSSAGAVVLDATTGFAGLTTVTVNSKSTTADTVIAAAATTDISITESDLKASGTSVVMTQGGKNVTISATGTTTQATALTFTDGTNAEIKVGSESAAAGIVNVTNSFKGTNGQKSGDVFVKGGTAVTVTQKVTNTTVNETNVQGDVGVLGTAVTTAVTVNQDATVGATATGTGLVGKTAGAVEIYDVNRTSLTAAGSIATVTLLNAGAAVINSGALTALNLGGTLTTVNAGTLGALTTPASTVLALNLTGAVSTGAVTIDNDIKTLNVSGNTTASTINSLVAGGATNINVSGAAKVTFTGNTTAAVTDIVVTNTGGAVFGTALGTTVNFTGGAGEDSIKLTTGFTKAITMGAGNDTVTYATGAGTGYSVAAGDGTADKIIMTAAEANAADADATFNTKFTGFEVLQLSADLTGGDSTINLDGLNNVSKVILTAGANGGTINNLVSGGTVEMTAATGGALAVNLMSALSTPNDVLNLNLKQTAVTAFNNITAANVKTININAADAAVLSSTVLGSDAVIHTMQLTATGTETIMVAGNNGLTLTNTGNTAVTLFDASGVVANDTAQGPGYAATTDTAANLAVTFASANNTAAATVTIKGGAGNDVLSGNIAKDVISGGAGGDYLYGDNQGTKEVQTMTLTHVAAVADTITINGISVAYTGGANAAADATAAITAINADTRLAGVVLASTGGAGVVVVTSLTDGNLDAITVGGTAATSATVETTAGTAGTVAVDTLDGGAGADLLVGGGGADTITTGTGADRVFFLKGHSNQAALATITDYTYAVGGTSNDTVTIGDVTAAAGTVTTVQDLSAQATLAAAFDAAALGNTVNNGLVMFIYGGNEYAYVETTGGNATYTAGDFAVKLTGTTIAAGTAIAGLGFDAV